MRGTSRASLDAARDRLDSLLASGSAEPDAVGTDLLAVAGLLSGQPALRRALVDPGRDGAARAGLAQLVLAGQVSPVVVDVVAGAARDRWATPRELVDSVEELGLDAVLAAAQRAGRLDEVEDDLFRFGRLVEAHPELRSALVDRAAPAASRRALAARLLEGRAAPETVHLVDHVVGGRRERPLDSDLDRLGALAARRREHVVATVRVAAALTPEHRARLADALAARVGHAVHLNVVVDPEVVGGIKVEMAGEVFDATVASRLDDASRRLAG